MRRFGLAAANLLALVVVVGLGPAIAEEPGRTTKAFTLENGIEVFLVSDPVADHSAAALAVDSGSMSDRDRPGIAHFLEHMLFLGTKKYPDEADYKDYLAKNDGHSNAYTAEDHTNYFFEVKNDAFEGALDRFSRFFIDPLMSDDLSTREVNAVDSEHSKNLQNEYWRTRQVYRSLLNPEHPQQGFSTGNRETLDGVQNKELWAHYEASYCSGLMHLAIVSRHPIDELEAWVRAKFAAVPNRGLKRLVPTVPLHHDALRGHLVEVKSLQDVHQLWMKFEMPQSAFDWRSKSVQLLGGVLGHEGPESLLQSLKDAGLAVGLSAGGQSNAGAGTFDLTISLTPGGMANLDTVLERAFGMINHLRSMPKLPDHVIEDRQKMAAIELEFRQPGPAAREAQTLAASMTERPHDDLLRAMYLIQEPDHAAIRAALDAMTPENAVVIAFSKDREANRVEPYYQAHYRVTPLGAERIAKLKAAEPAAGMDAPARNPFIPAKFDLIEPTHTDTPWAYELEHGKVWLRHDTLFRQPKVALRLDLINDKNSTSARELMLGHLYAAAVRRAMNPYAYPLSEAGVNLHLESERLGITLRASGYSEKIPEVVELAAPFLTEIRIDEPQFAQIKGEIERGFANLHLAPPTDRAFEVFRQVYRETHFTPEELAAALKDLRYADLVAYFGRVFEAIRLRGFVYGNMTEETVRGMVDTLIKRLGPKRAISEDDAYRGRGIRLAPGTSRIIRREIASNDSVTMMIYIGDEMDRTERAAITVLNKVLPPRFYGDLRTLQQTGYIVGADAFDLGGYSGIYLVSQSSVVDTDSLRGRFVAHLANFLKDLGEIDDPTFEANRGAALAEMTAKSKSFGAELERNVNLAFELHEDFADTEKQIAALRSLTREQWITAVRKFLGPRARRLAIQMEGSRERHQFQEGEIEEIRDGATFAERPRLK